MGKYKGYLGSDTFRIKDWCLRHDLR
jgi:hypothetical protein